MEKVQKNDFVEVKYTGYLQGKVFDSNIEEDLKKINPEAKVEKTIIIVGKGMVVKGLDNAIEGKELNKEYDVHIIAKEGFGERNRDLLKTIPLKVFTAKKLNPEPGMVFLLDNMPVKIIAVSGARVISDFNNPLAGKDVDYKFKIIKKVNDEKERCETVFSLLFKFVPEFDIKEKVIVKGIKEMEQFIKLFNDKFKELTGKELSFELKEDKKAEKEYDHSRHDHVHSHEHSHEEHVHEHPHQH